MARKQGQLQFPFARKQPSNREIRDIVRRRMDAFGAFEARHAARQAKRREANKKRRGH